MLAGPSLADICSSKPIEGALRLRIIIQYTVILKGFVMLQIVKELALDTSHVFETCVLETLNFEYSGA